MRRFRYLVVTGQVEQFQEQLTAFGDDGWRVVAATPGGDSWSAVLEQETAASGRGTGTSRSRTLVEVRDAEENVNTVVLEADSLVVVDGVVYLRRADEVLATYPVDDVVTVTWRSGSAYAQALERKRRDYPRHGLPWSADEDDRLRGEYDAGWTVAAMTDAHQRGPGAIESRLAKLGIQDSETPR